MEEKTKIQIYVFNEENKAELKAEFETDKLISYDVMQLHDEVRILLHKKACNLEDDATILSYERKKVFSVTSTSFLNRITIYLDEY